MEIGLEGKNIVVFGSSNGIGQAIARGFAAEGARVTGFDRAPAVGIDTTAGDVTSFDQVKAFAQRFATVDHVVFSVGAGSGKFGFPFWNLSPGDWPRVL